MLYLRQELGAGITELMLNIVRCIVKTELSSETFLKPNWHYYITDWKLAQ